MAKKILVCEDDENIIDIITLLLEEKGYGVVPLMHTKGIYETIDQEKPALILLDLGIPGEGGEAIAAKLKKQAHTENIPIIIMSANKDIVSICKKIGADDFISKPFDISEFQKTIETHIMKT